MTGRKTIKRHTDPEVSTAPEQATLVAVRIDHDANNTPLFKTRSLMQYFSSKMIWYLKNVDNSIITISQLFEDNADIIELVGEKYPFVEYILNNEDTPETMPIIHGQTIACNYFTASVGRIHDNIPSYSNPIEFERMFNAILFVFETMYEYGMNYLLLTRDETEIEIQRYLNEMADIISYTEEKYPLVKVIMERLFQ